MNNRIKNAKGLTRREVLKMGAIGLGGLALGNLLELPVKAGEVKNTRMKKVNVLFINTDQLRFDALSCAGNPYVSTPNLDKLSREGVNFTMAVTPQAMTAAAMTSYMTGLSIYSHGVVSVPDPKNTHLGSGSFDQNLVKSGYRAEYHGRWGMPMELADCYDNKVVSNWISLYKSYIKETLGDPPKPEPGQFVSFFSGWPYTPDPTDYEYRVSIGNPPGHNCYGVEYGIYTLPAEHTLAAFIADRTIDAMKRHHDVPFAITGAFLQPHHPQYVAKPYAGSIDPERMKHPLTMNDRRLGTPYVDYPWQIDGTEKRYMKLIHARYYELVQEMDHHVGRILRTLDDLGIADNTLVIFTSDHGEMLGDHGLTQKFVHYKESIRIPLIMRLPGKISAGTNVDHPVNSVDIFATIYDYLGMPCPKQEGRSLRPLIEGKKSDYPEYTFSEMSNYTLFTSREWKYVWHVDANQSDILYDLQNDPYELSNLLGSNPDRTRYIPKANEIRKQMLEWMESIQHPLRDDFAKSKVR
ncbi:MAG: sulfatase-like hydrolase/transferase [Armatimonadota bacterium]